MRRLLVVCSLITMLIGAAGVSAILFEHTRPPIDLVRAAGLDYCNASICFRGVALGADWKNAIEKLMPNTDFFGRDWLQVVTVNSIYDMTSLDTNKSIVGHITSGPTYGLPLLLGDIVGQYGAPCLVSYLTSTNDGVQITLIYPHFDVGTPRFDHNSRKMLGDINSFWQLDPKMPVEYADFYLNQDNCAIPDQLPKDTYISNWGGFGSFK